MTSVYVLRIIGLQGKMMDPHAESPIGKFITGFRPLAYDGLGEVLFSPNLPDALAFETADEAIGYYRQVPRHRPVKPDGKPNRPLTAFTVEVLQAAVIPRKLDA